MSVMQRIFKYEIEQIISVQNKLESFETILAFLSEFMRPTIVFQYIVPLIGALDAEMLVEMTFAESVADCLGLVLKWLVNEDRPYWWIRETNLYTDKNRPQLRQHPLTCESTSGSPSGHNIITTVFLYIVCKYGAKYIHRHYDVDKRRVRWIASVIFVISSTIMWPIRMYFGCHFLHQCMLGTLVGYTVVKIVENRHVRKKVYETSMKKAMLISAGLAGILGSIYLGLRLTGLDPHWSVKMAFRWCEQPLTLSHESTPVYSLVKNFGSLCGLALSAPLIERSNTELNRWRSVPFAASMIILNKFLLAQTPKNHGTFIFLAYSFSLNLAFYYAIVGLMTKICGQHPKDE